MHKFNIFISGPESFVSTFNELESYFKFNISSNQKKLSAQFINNLHGIIIHHDTSNNNQLKGILKDNNCLKILATNNNSVILKNYDYVLKLPTSIDEINNIIEGSIAKKEFAKNSSILIKSYLLDKNEKKLIKEKDFIILTEKEIHLLEILLNSKEPISKNEILAKVWNYSSDTDTHTVETHIYRLRKKINEKFSDDNFLLNNKKGYYL